MKIFCDIGNTYAKILLAGEKVKFKKISIDKVIKFLIKYKKFNIYISCVVKKIEKEIKRKFKKAHFLGYKDIKDFMKIRYRNLKQLGSDRIFSALACKEIFGKNTLVISCGTALVVDYIDRRNVYSGGVIFPGINILCKSLYDSTSKLPYLKLKNTSSVKVKNKNIVGRDTFECIYKGIVSFITSGIEYFLNVLKPQKIIITGGDAELVSSFLIKKKIRISVVKELVLLGIILWGIKKGVLKKEKVKDFIENFYDNIDIIKIFL
ncbi:MAG: type III pantothenate kinase [Endomicrobiia bacterium]